MKERRITIDIDGEGRLSADAEGFEGNQCIQELQKLLEGFAADWEHVERKPDATAARAGAQRVIELNRGKKP